MTVEYVYQNGFAVLVNKGEYYVNRKKGCNSQFRKVPPEECKIERYTSYRGTSEISHLAFEPKDFHSFQEAEDYVTAISLWEKYLFIAESVGYFKGINIHSWMSEKLQPKHLDILRKLPNFNEDLLKMKPYALYLLLSE